MKFYCNKNSLPQRGGLMGRRIDIRVLGHTIINETPTPLLHQFTHTRLQRGRPPRFGWGNQCLLRLVVGRVLEWPPSPLLPLSHNNNWSRSTTMPRKLSPSTSFGSPRKIMNIFQFHWLGNLIWITRSLEFTLKSSSLSVELSYFSQLNQKA